MTEPALEGHQKRHSIREKRAASIDDLGYNNREQLKRAGKGASEAYRKCERVLAQLRKHPSAAQFLYPVQLSGYTDVIKEPMDVSTVERKLKTGMYTSTGNFVADVRKIWNNAWTFNQPGSSIYMMTTQVSDYFEGMMREIEDVPFVPGENSELMELKKKVNKVTGALRKMAGNVPSAAPPRATSNAGKKPADRPMTAHEKAQLGQNIRRLPQEKVIEMLNLLRDVVDLSKARDGVELDIDKLPTKKCRELEQYVRRALAPKKGKSGGSRLLLQPTQEHAAAEVMPAASATAAPMAGFGKTSSVAAEEHKAGPIPNIEEDSESDSGKIDT